MQLNHFHPSAPYFTVIMPTFNRAHSLIEAIRSVRNQSFESWELIIVDDGSYDNTQEILKEIALQDGRIKLLHQKNGGAAAARNYAIRNSLGRYFAFLDSDDTFEINHLQSRKKILDADPKIDFMYGGWRIIGNPYVPDRSNTFLMVHLEESDIHGAGTFVIRAQTLRLLRGFPDVRYAEDSILLELAFTCGFNMKRCFDQTYVYNRQTEDSVCNLIAERSR